MISEYERQALWKDACEQARIAGVDPADPIFLKHARSVRNDRPFYDQITHVILQTRAEREAPERRKDTEGHLTLSEAIEEAKEYHTIR